MRTFRAAALLLALLSVPAAARAQDNRALRVVAPVEIGGLEPARSGAIFARMGVTETLVAADLEGKPVPALAERWGVDETGLAWSFRLRPGARFHDGSAVTAGAVAASLERARNSAGAVLARAPIAAIAAEGADTVAVQLERPFSPLPAFLAHYASAVLAPASWDDTGRVREVVGTGPYRVVDVTPPMRLEVARFEGWWGAEPAAIARAVYLVAGQGEMRALMAESGQADLAFALQPATVARLQRNPKLDVRLVKIPRTRMLKLNAASPMLDDPRERQALSLAIDRKGIAGAILRNPALAANQLLPPSVADWHLPDLPPPARDLPRARALLAEAGWRPGPDGALRDAEGRRFRLLLRTYSTWPELPPIATALQAQFREAGVELEVSVGNASDIPLGHRDGTLEIGLMSRNYSLVPDPLGSMLADFGPDGGDWGAMNWRSEELAAALARMGEADAPAERTALRRRASAILRDELPVIPIVWSELGVAINRRVAGAVVDPLETTYRLHEMRWAAAPAAAAR